MTVQTASTASELAELLLVSAILAVRNEEANNKRILERIFWEDHTPHRREVIVVDE